MRKFYPEDFVYQPHPLEPVVICSICGETMADIFVKVAVHLQAYHHFLMIPDKGTGINIKERVLRPITIVPPLYKGLLK
jgi:hypothetical protein